VLKANQGASNVETEEITCGPAVRTWLMGTQWFMSRK